MKKVVALLLVLCFLLCGCVSTEPEIDENLIKIEITDYGAKNIDYTVMNLSKKSVELGDSYTLEFKEGKNWVPVPETGEAFFSMIAYVIYAGEGKSFSEDFEMRYGVLQNGTYRIVKEVYIWNEDGETCGKQQITAEFKI